MSVLLAEGRTFGGWGELFIPEPMDEWALRRFARRAQHRWGLCPAEARSLFILCSGYTEGKQTAELLGRSVQTVKNHRTSIFRKLGAGDATNAVLIAWHEYRRARREPVAGKG